MYRSPWRALVADTRDRAKKTNPYNHLMKRRPTSWQRWLRTTIALSLAAAAFVTASNPCLKAEDTKATAGSKDPKPEKAKPEKTEKKVQKLSGAELYALHCNRCHPERYPTEWNSAHWKTIMLHMRVRANLPAAQANAILKYLQEDSGN
jgi:hypothetical protein